LYAALPGILAQTGQPLTLYNGGTPETANCVVKKSACDCHYASCSITGDCACGWDDASQTCRAGIPTRCASCPAMRRCGVKEKLIIGPDGFPVPGQLSVWGNVPYPDEVGVMSSSSSRGNSASQPQFVTTRMPPMPTMQPASVQVFGQAQMTSQPFGQPTTLYQNNVLSAGGCTAKTNPCDCHYASCTETGDCACGWDQRSQTCRAGIQTACASCPAMHRCGVSQKLIIGPDGFPVRGQLSVWGNTPYPDQSDAQPSNPVVSSQNATQSTPSTPGKGKNGKGKAGKAGKGKNGKAAKSANQTQAGM